jgi:hypothetical protein
VVAKTEIPIDQILPCHINRDQRLVTAGIDWVGYTCEGFMGRKEEENGSGGEPPEGVLYIMYIADA